MVRRRKGGYSPVRMWDSELYGCEQTEFPERLRKLREAQGRKRQTVSELAGLPSDAVRRYERREACPSMNALVKLADYFEVSLDYLIGRTNFR